MQVVGLFAGIGGVEVGLAASGHRSILFCENWAPAAAVLSERFPDVPNHGDVAALVSLPGAVDVVAAGFPCQDLSQAGLTAGIHGRRSSLVDHVFRLIDLTNVPSILIENVSFMLRLDGGSAMLRLASAFEERGYRWAYRVVNSLSFLPQRRERVFFLASKQFDPSDVLLVDEVEAPTVTTTLDSHAHGFYWTEGTRGLGWGPDCVPTLKNGSTVGIPSPPAILLTDSRIVTPDIRDAERLQGFSADWTRPAEEVGRPSLRWSLVGNAVTVPVSAWVGRRLAEPGSYDSSRDRAFEDARSWPRAARYDGRRRHVVTISDRPLHAPRLPLQRFLEFPGRLLSERATAGFLKRIDKSSLRFVPGFKDRVRAHLTHVRALDRFFDTRAIAAAE